MPAQKGTGLKSYFMVEIQTLSYGIQKTGTKNRIIRYAEVDKMWYWQQEHDTRRCIRNKMKDKTVRKKYSTEITGEIMWRESKVQGY